MSFTAVSWARCARKLENYTMLERRLNALAESHGGDDDDDIVNSKTDLRRFLRRLSHQVEAFRPHFARHRHGRSRPSMRIAYMWAHVGGLSMQKLLQDIDDQLNTHDRLLRTRLHCDTGNVLDAHMRRQYYAVLVTTEAKHYFGWLSDYLCAEADTPPRIDWEARDTSVLLPLRDSLVFRRHFALCLVQKEVWESTHIRLVDKFADQPFWDYYGKPNSYTVQQTWTDDEIVKINGIQSLGLIRSDGNVLQELSNYHNQLLRQWTYRKIWWNSADFALCLAGLAVSGPGVALCRDIYRRLVHLRETTVIQAREDLCAKNFIGGAVGFAACLIATALTGGASAPVTIPAALASWGWGFGSGVVAARLQGVGGSRRRRRAADCANLRRRFRRLRPILAWRGPG